MAVRFVLGRALARRAAPRSQTILPPEARRHGRRERAGGQWGGVKGAPESALYCDPVVPRLGRGRMSHGHPLDRYIGQSYPALEEPAAVAGSAPLPYAERVAPPATYEWLRAAAPP